MFSMLVIAAQEFDSVIVQQSKSTFYKAILKMGATQTKNIITLKVDFQIGQICSRLSALTLCQIWEDIEKALSHIPTKLSSESAQTSPDYKQHLGETGR